MVILNVNMPMCSSSASYDVKIAERKQEIHNHVTDVNNNLTLPSHREHILSSSQASYTEANTNDHESPHTHLTGQ